MKNGKICKICIVKRKGHQEEFDEKKVYASDYAACLVGSLKEKEAEKIAEKVTRQVKNWVSKKQIIGSKDIFRLVVSLLKNQNKEVAFLYETHRDVS